MHILLTNDDGIFAEGIYALYHELKKIATVTVVAPDSERSSVGHGITLSHPIWHKRVNRKGKFFGFSLSGTPADCVKFGINVILRRKPDAVVSGINLGPNDGCSVIYSGTVAGAREGALLGIPAIAVSLGTFVNPKFSFAAQCARQLTSRLLRQGCPKGSFLNVNIPNLPQNRIKGIKMTRQCMTPIHGTFRRRVDPHLKDYYWMTGKFPIRKKDDRFDTYALNDDYVTVTPIQNDLTDYTFLDKLKNWPLTI